MSLGFSMRPISIQDLKLKVQQGPFTAVSFFLFEKPKQFSNVDNFYYATMDWVQHEFEGKQYWRAEVLALNDAETDRKRCARAESYMNRCKLRWESHNCDYWSCGCKMPNGEFYDYAGKPIFKEWLRSRLNG